MNVIKGIFFSTKKLIINNIVVISIFDTFKSYNQSMRFNILLLSILTVLFFNGCQTIKNKSDEVAERENEKFGQFVGKQVSEIRSELGLPTDDYIDELGNETLVYKTKKYGIPCERKFTINTSGTIIGFSSSGCI